MIVAAVIVSRGSVGVELMYSNEKVEKKKIKRQALELLRSSAKKQPAKKSPAATKRK